MEIRLLKLTLKNFQGIPELAFEPNGKNAIIRGDNGTGKTTVNNAWNWLLFGKDSQGKTDFDLKPLDKDNNPVHNLETEVEGTLLVDGEPLTLRKVFAEKWTRKRGQATAEFTGHTTSHFINEVPVQAKDYRAKIDELIDEELFKLLTSPSYFNEQLHWTKRREIVLGVCGDLADEEVIGANPKLKKLGEILKDRKLDDYQAILAGKRKKINEELSKIPVRIDEATMGLPDISGINPDALPADIEIIKKSISDKQAELSRVENGGGGAEKVKQLREVEAELFKIRAEFGERINEQVLGEQKKIDELQEKKRELLPQCRPEKVDALGMEGQVQSLRDEWQKVNAQEYDGSDTCPTCGQDLPENMVEEALANFNRQKAEKLEQITAEGKRLKAELEKTKTENAERNTKASEACKRVRVIDEQINNINAEIEGLKSRHVFKNPEYAAKEKEKAELEKDITTLRASCVDMIQDIKNDLEAYETAQAALLESQQKVEAHKNGKTRIAELEAQQKQLAKEFENIEAETFLCEEFTRAKVAMLDEKVNSKFKLARFKMFNQLVNGGIEECCETIYGGVPYGTGLNSGHKIIVGLDIINTLSDHYKFCAPIWIDNRESVTQLPEMKAQVIGLEVSAEHKKLDVEVCE